MTIFVFVICIVFVAMVVILPLPIHRVCITEVMLPGGKYVSLVTRKTLVLPKEASNSFIISYTHSVNKGLVKDYYSVNKNKSLLLLKTRFSSYGAGMPEPNDWPGQFFVKTEDFVEIQQINRIYPYFQMAVGVIANHCVETENEFFRLVDFFEPQTRLVIKYRCVTAKEIIFNVIKKRYS